MDKIGFDEYLIDAYREEMPESTMPPSIQSMMDYLGGLFVMMTCERAMLFNDIYMHSFVGTKTKMKDEILSFLEDNPDKCMEDFIDELHEGYYTYENSEEYSEFMNEIESYMKHHDIFYADISHADDYVYYQSEYYSELDSKRLKDVILYNTPIKKVW